jgi:hypothetical protein
MIYIQMIKFNKLVNFQNKIIKENLIIMDNKK